MYGVRNKDGKPYVEKGPDTLIQLNLTSDDAIIKNAIIQPSGNNFIVNMGGYLVLAGSPDVIAINYERTDVQQYHLQLMYREKMEFFKNTLPKFKGILRCKETRTYLIRGPLVDAIIDLSTKKLSIKDDENWVQITKMICCMEALYGPKWPHNIVIDNFL